MMTIPYDRLVRFAADFLAWKGARPADALLVAESIAATEAFGTTTHGLAFLPYADRSIPSIIDPSATPRLVADRGAVAVIEGARSFAQVAMHLAVATALARAKLLGTAVVGVRNTGWLGALGIHLLPVAENGMLGQLWAQTNTSRDCAPVGGVDARFSTNPVALAIPTGGDPVVADFSTAAASMAKTLRMAGRGERAVERIYLDRDGQPSDDPRVVRDGGTILFTGGEHHGHKGYALSLWCEALAAAAGGECNNPSSRTSQNFTLQVVDPAALVGRDTYTAEIDRLLHHVRTSRPRAGTDRVRVPGDRGLAALRRARTEGVPVDGETAAMLDDLADRAGIASPTRQ
jgi:L-lactate dehydrogenase